MELPHHNAALSILPEKVTLKIKLEKNQRGGKLVTVIHELPFNPAYFEDLTKKLKNHCGTGGTFKSGDKSQIELQGDQREKVESFLNEKGLVKVEIGLARGKSEIDKRETIKRREWEKEKHRILKNQK